jgi:hypothetical protein
LRPLLGDAVSAWQLTLATIHATDANGSSVDIVLSPGNSTGTSDWIAAAHGYGYVCSGNTVLASSGGNGASLTIEKLVVQPFNVQGDAVAPKPGNGQ